MTEDEHANWEYGGFFALSIGEDGNTDGTPWSADHVLYRSGTDALRGLATWGREHGWRKLHVPSYFCTDVLPPIAQTIELCTYDDGPTRGPRQLRLGPDDAVLAVEYFGRPHHLEVDGGWLIVDRTHDPLASWSYDRRPDFAIASLRKQLPLPDGGCLWSPTGRQLPPHPALTAHHAATLRDALIVMAMRAAHLDGVHVDRAAMLALRGRVELALGDGDVSCMSGVGSAMLHGLNPQRLRDQRVANLRSLDALWEPPVPWLQRLEAESYLVLATQTPPQRAALRHLLIEASVFPMVLWPVDASRAAPEEARLSETILVLPIDHRYRQNDIERLLATLRRAVAHVEPCVER